MNVATGEASAVHRVDCCTPDWFPDSQHVIFSWRPPGQKSNPGYGWTQLWRTDAEGKSPQLVYGEDGRHVYGGHVSPDGKYVLFTGNMQEDGDPGNAGAPMGLMRLSDAPIIGGESTGAARGASAGQERSGTHAARGLGTVLDVAANSPSASTRPRPTQSVETSAGSRRCRPGSRKSSARLRLDCVQRQDRPRRLGFVPDAPRRFGPAAESPTHRTSTKPVRASRAMANDCFTTACPRPKRWTTTRTARSNWCSPTRMAGNAVVWGKDYPWASWGPDGAAVGLPDAPGNPDS